jgi:Sec-independent protein translocase protein TatA
MPDIIFILLLALVIFGPRKLPEIARHCAKYLVQFRRMKDEVTLQVQGEMSRLEADNSFLLTGDDSNRSLTGITETNSLGTERPADLCAR